MNNLSYAFQLLVENFWIIFIGLSVKSNHFNQALDF